MRTPYCTLLFVLLISVTFSCQKTDPILQIEEKLNQQLPFQDSPDIQLFFLPKDSLRKKLLLIDASKKQLNDVKTTPTNQSSINQLNKRIDRLQKRYQSLLVDPSVYNLGGALHKICSTDSLSQQQKNEILYQTISMAPKYYRTGINLIKSKNNSLIELAIEKQLLTLKYLKEDLQNCFSEGTHLQTNELSKNI
ncbi:MAG: hypothetical protein AAFO07_27300, partial [Bacteroidota bacterium]